MRLPYCMSRKTFKERSWILWEKSRASRPQEGSLKIDLTSSEILATSIPREPVSTIRWEKVGRESGHAIRRPSFLMSSRTSRPAWGRRVVLVDGPCQPHGLLSSTLLTRTFLSESSASESRSRKRALYGTRTATVLTAENSVFR